jgi:hypothetical protein
VKSTPSWLVSCHSDTISRGSLTFGNLHPIHELEVSSSRQGKEEVYSRHVLKGEESN